MFLGTNCTFTDEDSICYHEKFYHILKIYNNIAVNLGNSTVNKIILLDFVDNYLLVIQDAVQGFHWENSQAMLHPLVVYHASPNSVIEYLIVCFVSDHQSHNQSAVHAFLAIGLSFVKKVSFC